MSSNYRLVFLTILSATIMTTAIGLIFFGVLVFDNQTQPFQFISIGLLASVFFALFQAGRNRDAIFAGLLIFLIFYLLFAGSFFVTHLLFNIIIFISVLLYSSKVHGKMRSVKYLRPLVLSAIFSVSYVYVSFLLALIFNNEGVALLQFRSMIFGLGLGLEVAKWLQGQK